MDHSRRWWREVRGGNRTKREAQTQRILLALQVAFSKRSKQIRILAAIQNLRDHSLGQRSITTFSSV